MAAEVSTVIAYPGAVNPYGFGNNGTASEYIFVAESWAEHVARWMDDLQYNESSNGFTEQGIPYKNTFTNAGVFIASSHANYLEGFRPTLTDDPFHWIPYGIYWDLIDNRNDFAFDQLQVVDLVSGYYTNKDYLLPWIMM